MPRTNARYRKTSAGLEPIGKSPNLTQAELTFVTAILEGKSIEDCSQAAGISTATAYRWVKKPHIERAITIGEESKLRTISTYQAERTRVVLPTVHERSLELMDTAIDAWRGGLARLSEIIQDESVSARTQVMAITEIRMSIGTLSQLAGVMQTERVLHGKEQKTCQEGMSTATFNQIMESILGVPLETLEKSELEEK